jgi:hypothetical protein
MFDQSSHDVDHAWPSVAQECARIEANLDRLTEAASRLAGRRGRRVAQRLRSLCEDGESVGSPRMRRALNALHDILTLRCVDDPEGEEAELFAAIWPGDPIVEEFCRLADLVGEILQERDPG